MKKSNLRIVYPVGAGGQFLAYAISKAFKDKVAQYRFVPHEQGYNRWKYVPEWCAGYEFAPLPDIKVDASLFGSDGPHDPWNARKKTKGDYVVSITPHTPGELFWCLVNSRMKNLYNDSDTIEHKKSQTDRKYWYLSEFLYHPKEDRESVVSHDNCPDYPEYIRRIKEVEVDRDFSYNTWFIEKWQRDFITSLGKDLDIEVDDDEFVKIIKRWTHKQRRLLEQIVDDINLFKAEDPED